MFDDVLIIIPARLDSQRLFQKPLQMIGKDYCMIEHMVRQVAKTNLKNIYVATDSDAIGEKVVDAGGKYILTKECPTGTDRVYEALQHIKSMNVRYVINIQGDMPFIKPQTILSLVEFLKSSDYDIVTPVSRVDKKVAESDSNVKVVMDANNKALYFSRSLIPSKGEEFLYHVGLYGFKKEILEKFVKLPMSFLEKNENLEQLRALENNIDIGICVVNDVPISIDTQEDLEKAIKFYNQQ